MARPAKLFFRPPRTPLPEVQKQKHRKETKHLLLCGLDAINHLFRHFKKESIERNRIDEINDEIATAEAITAIEEVDEPANHVDERGNYPVDVLLTVLDVYGHLDTNRWKPGEPITATAYLVGCGAHWTAVVKNSQDLWFEKDKRTQSILNPGHYFKGKDRHGAIYAIHERKMDVDDNVNIIDDAPTPTFSTAEIVHEIQNLPNPLSPSSPTPTTPPPNVRPNKSGRKSAKDLPDDEERRSARADGHRSRVQEKRASTINRSRSLPAKRAEKFKITLKNNGPLDPEKTKMLQSLVPFTNSFVDRENKDEDQEPDLPEMMYDHTYLLFFASQEDHDRALNILQSSSLITEDKCSINTGDSKPWRSPERKRD